MRKIIHIDMDAFYASVEQRDNPELRGRPVVVGGSSNRGVVAAASYEARAYGVHSAMPSAVANRKCPNLVFVRARFEVYTAVSRQIRKIFKRYTDLVEPLSLDEAFLDVTNPKAGPQSATLIAQEIRQAIRDETGLTASAGVSFNKFLAKVGSGMDKPDGLTLIAPEAAPSFMARLPIEKFFGIGAVTARRMHEIGVRNGHDLLLLSEDELVARFGKAGKFYYRIVRCEDDRPVRTHRIRKSIGAERTFERDIGELSDLREKLRQVVDKVADRMERAAVMGHTVTVKIKYHDFVVTTRQTTSSQVLYEKEELFEIADLLLRYAPEPPLRPVRLIGVSVSKLRMMRDGPWPEQLRLAFAETDEP